MRHPGLAWMSVVGFCSLLGITAILNGCGSSSLCTGQKASLLCLDFLSDGPVNSFAGRIPCADCAGIQMTLTLRQDGIYFLRQEYMGVSGGDHRSVSEIGEWEEESYGRLALRRPGETSLLLDIRGNGRLRLRDVQGHAIESDLNYDLKRLDEPDYFQDGISMMGMYLRVGSPRRILICNTTLELPVAPTRDYQALDDAAWRASATMSGPLMVMFKGHLAVFTDTTGEPFGQGVVIDSFESVIPGESCGPAGPNAPLVETYWKIMQLGNVDVSQLHFEPEPHIRFTSNYARFVGTGFCNELTGQYQVAGDSLRIDRIGMTKRACPEGMAEDDLLARGLGVVTGYRIVGERLEIFSFDTLVLVCERRLMP